MYSIVVAENNFPFSRRYIFKRLFQEPLSDNARGKQRGATIRKEDWIYGLLSILFKKGEKKNQKTTQPLNSSITCPRSAALAVCSEQGREEALGSYGQ